jgi:hypothetical protein
VTKDIDSQIQETQQTPSKMQSRYPLSLPKHSRQRCREDFQSSQVWEEECLTLGRKDNGMTNGCSEVKGEINVLIELVDLRAFVRFCTTKNIKEIFSHGKKMILEKKKQKKAGHW